MIELGKVYEWSEIVEKYPDMYAIITDYEHIDGGGAIGKCKVLDIVPYEDMEDTVCKYLDMGITFLCQRTTFNGPDVGVWF